MKLFMSCSDRSIDNKINLAIADMKQWFSDCTNSFSNHEYFIQVRMWTDNTDHIECRHAENDDVNREHIIYISYVYKNMIQRKMEIRAFGGRMKREEHVSCNAIDEIKE